MYCNKNETNLVYLIHFYFKIIFDKFKNIKIEAMKIILSISNEITSNQIVI